MVRRTENHYRALFEAAPTGVLAVDATGLIVLANEQTEKIFGYSRDELIGRPVEMLIPERFHNAHVRCRKQFAHAPQMRSMGENRDLRGARKDGSECCLEVGLSFSTTSDGQIFTATIADITELRRAEEHNARKERSRAILETLQLLRIAAVALDENGHVQSQNESFQTLRPHMVGRGDSIELPDTAANALLKQAVADLSVKDADQAMRQIPIVPANGRPPMIGHFFPVMSTGKEMFNHSLGIFALTTLTTGNLLPADSELTELLHRLFLLTPAEARVVALIGSGLSPREAATALGIAEETARSTLKHAFVKVGISRQSKLAVLLTKIAHW